MFVLLCLLFVAQYAEAQCDVTLSANVTHVGCFGANTGAIDLSASGGTAPYNYLWSNGQTDEDLTDLAPGMYFVTVTDQLGCVANLARPVNEPALLTVMVPDGLLNCDNPSIQLSATVQGGTSPYQYFWSNGVLGNPVGINVAGTYHVTIVDANSCTASAQLQVMIDTIRPVADAGPDRLLDCQTPAVTIGGNNSSTGANYLYNWSGPGITNGVGGNSIQQFPSVNKPGVYTLFVINDLNGCFAEDEMQVGGQAPPVANAGPDTGLPCGGGQLTLTGAGSSAGVQYTYQWSTPDGQFVAGTNTLNPVVDAPGTYRIAVTDLNTGCTIFDDVKVFPGPAIPVQNHSILDVSCTGQLGIAGVDMTQGTGPYTYLWSNGGTNAAIINVGIGTYTVTVMDATGCNYYAELVVKDTSTLDLEALTTNPTCGIGNNGAIDLVLTGIFGPFEFAWSTGATTEDLNNLTAGTYTVTVTYALATCTEILNVSLSNTSPMTLSTVVTNINSCTGSLGAIDLTVTAGVAPLDFAWSNGEIAEDLNNLPAGVYWVTVTDATGCTQTTSATVGNDFNLNATLVPTSATCTGGNPCNGFIDLTITSGTPPFEYFWSTGVSAQDHLNCCPGTYTVTISDANGCTKSFSTVVGQSGATIMATAVPTNASCGLNNGSIDLTVTGGGGNYIYNWSNNTFNQDLTNLAPGTYTVTVSEFPQCIQTASATVVQAADMALSTFVVNDECGANGGLIELTVNGGSGTFTYQWSNGSTFQNILNLTPGTYTVTVTDLGGCTKTTSATIVYISGLTLNLVVTDATCNGNDGSIDLSVQGGIGPYSYLWMTGPTTQDVSGLVGGTYTVTVTSGANCTETASVQVGQSASFVLNATVVPSNGCIQPNGAIDLTVTPPGVYNYQWSNGVITTEDINNLTSGNYSVTVTDGSNCSKVATYFVPDNPNAPSLSAIPTASTCGFSNGMIDLTVTGGAGPFTYLWSNGVTTEDLFNITSGQYDVTVTGSNGCSNTASVLVDNFDPVISLSGIVMANSACFSGNGSIDLSVTPAGNYTYNWSGSQATEDIFGLSSGTYSVTVSAGGTCTAVETFNVGSIANAPILSTTVTDASCNGNDGAIDLTVSGGTSPYTYLWSNGVTNEDQNNLSLGTYTVTVTDVNACSNTASATVGQSSNILATTVVTNVSCFGGNNGSIDLTVTGGAPGYTYTWSNNTTTQDLSGMVAGTYTVTVTDVNGCTTTASASVSQPTDLVLSTIITPVSCFGGSDGAIDLSVTGGTPVYVYIWNTSVTPQDLINFPAGIYTVTVTDVMGCEKTTSAVVTQPAQLTFDIVSLSNNCTSETITGPNVPNFTYQWIGPGGFSATTHVVTVSFSGVYSLIITDVNGCTTTEDYTVNLTGSGACGILKGRVVHDEDESCTLDAGEPGLAGWIVRAEGANDTLYGVTDAQGQYHVGVPIGTYSMSVFVPNALWTICPGGAPVTLNTAGDTIAAGDFPVKSAFICPALTVSMGTNKLRRCFSGNFYHVEYCNQGTAAAQDAYVTVALDPFLTVLSSSAPYTDLGSNVLQFDLGTLDIGECGSFNIEVFVNCNAVLGQTHCSQASIYPDSLCVPPNANWSGASLQVSSICNPDSLRFVIKNVGTGTMNNTTGYIVVEDGVMFRQGILAPLAENESMEIAVPANGSTWRVEVGQEAFHPYPAPVGLSVEGCATSSSFSTGFVNQFTAQDEPSSTDIDCTTNIGSFDPNDKHSYPVGYGADHYIRPGTDIEYLIRFQNTGTDTAFTVEIVDTLSNWLDPTTIRFGASSHPYQYDLNGQGIVHFLFEDILLPDSFTNEVASHGFAKFSIKPRLDAPLQTRIENTAAIYFDFNDPIFTNTTFHRLGENFITVGLWQPETPDATVVAMPNPFNQQTILEVKGLSHNAGLRLEVYDLRGNVVRIMESENAFFQLKKEDWPSGIYLFKITQNGRLVGNGKLMAE